MLQAVTIMQHLKLLTQSPRTTELMSGQLAALAYTWFWLVSVVRMILTFNWTTSSTRHCFSAKLSVLLRRWHYFIAFYIFNYLPSLNSCCVTDGYGLSLVMLIFLKKVMQVLIASVFSSSGIRCVAQMANMICYPPCCFKIIPILYIYLYSPYRQQHTEQL